MPERVNRSLDPAPNAFPSSRRVAIVQSSYVPWKGYFDLIASVDEFILFDDVQYTRRDWRNRNKIKTAHGPIWLTIPVKVKGKYLQLIRETEVADPSWAMRHWRTISQSYARCPFFSDYSPGLEAAYREAAERTYLSAVNETLIRRLCACLHIETKITRSMDYEVLEGKSERLLHLCRQAGATEYLSGPSARGYLDTALFYRAGIGVRFFDYTGYREHRQAYPPFAHDVSVLDLLLNEGPAARTFLKAFSPTPQPRPEAVDAP